MTQGIKRRCECGFSCRRTLEIERRGRDQHLVSITDDDDGATAAETMTAAEVDQWLEHGAYDCELRVSGAGNEYSVIVDDVADLRASVAELGK